MGHTRFTLKGHQGKKGVMLFTRFILGHEDKRKSLPQKLGN